MSDTTIATGGTLTLSASLSGNVTFANVGTDSGVLLIEPGALSYGTAGSQGVQTFLGGDIVGFSPGDTIVLANVEQDYANFDQAPGSLTNNASFDSAILDLARLGGVELFVAPGDVISSNNFFVNALYGAELQTLAAPYLGSVETALFGTDTLSATLTISPTLEAGGTIVDAVMTTDQPIAAPCFVAGTRIRTLGGEVAVERLVAGDVVLTAANGPQLVRWIGTRTLDLTRHPRPEAARPVRFAAGALAEGVPVRDLWVSPDHAMLLDGVLVPASALIDGVLITQDETCRQVRYYHVELDRHDILIAEGAPAESYLDSGNRGMFANGGAPVSLHPDLMARVRRAGGCARLVTEGPELAEIRTRLDARKAALGWERVEISPWLRSGNLVLAPAQRQTGSLAFDLPCPMRRVDLLVGSFVPAEVDPASVDRRRLGIAIGAITLDGRPVPVERAIAPRLRHPRAVHDRAIWTRGDVRINLPRAGSRLVIDYVAIGRNWCLAGAGERRRRRGGD